MKIAAIIFLFIGGMLFLLAARPTFAQERELPENSINKQVLRDFEKLFIEKVAAGKVDLEASFTIEINGSTDKGGRVDPAAIKFTKSEGDARSIQLIREGLKALSESRYLDYIGRFSPGKPFTLSVEQNEANFAASFALDMESAGRARNLKTLLSMYISSIIQKRLESPFSGNKEDFESFQNAVQGVLVEAVDKKVVLKFTMAKPAFQTLLRKHIPARAAVPK